MKTSELWILGYISCIELNFTHSFVSNKVSCVNLQSLLKCHCIMYPVCSDYGEIMADWKTGQEFPFLTYAS